jgi:LemA protein
MSSLVFFGSLLLAFSALAAWSTHTQLVQLRNKVWASWRDIDAELQRRHELIPNLLATVQNYAQHENATLDSLATLRSQALAAAATPTEQQPRQQAITQGIGNVFAVAEKYPELKANDAFAALQAQLVTAENRIEAARRVYNSYVRSYDTRCETFPSMLIARRGKFEPAPYFEIDPAARSSVSTAS